MKCPKGLVLLSFVVVSACERSNIEESPAILSELEAIQFSEPFGPVAGENFEKFRSLIDDASVVALGESRHDTKEQFEAKAILSKTLIEHLGFRTIILEESFSHALALDAYVTSGLGDVRSILNGLAGWYLWDTEEMVVLIEWIRRFNKNAPRDQMVRVFGMDITAPALGLRDAIRVADDLDPSAGWAEREYGLDLHSGDMWPQTLGRYSALLDEDIKVISENLQSIHSFFKNQGKSSVEPFPRADLQLLIMQTEIAMRGHDMFSATGIADIGHIRERGMAAVVEWTINRRGNDARTIIWTHNLHAAKGSFQMPQMTDGDLYPMGVLLDQIYGEDYVVIGGTFGTGYFPPSMPPGERSFPRMGAETVDGAIGELGASSILVSFREIDTSSDVSKWLAAAREWRMQDTSAILSPGTSFDAIYYVDEVTRAQLTPLALQKHGEPDE
jgi:erythromycin esterase